MMITKDIDMKKEIQRRIYEEKRKNRLKKKLFLFNLVRYTRGDN